MTPNKLKKANELAEKIEAIKKSVSTYESALVGLRPEEIEKTESCDIYRDEKKAVNMKIDIPFTKENKSIEDRGFKLQIVVRRDNPGIAVFKSFVEGMLQIERDTLAALEAEFNEL